MSESPQWRQAYDALDRQIAPRLEEWVRSDQFAVLAGLASRAQSSVERQATETSRRLLHRFNLPAGSDVTRILNELGQLRRELHELRHDLALLRAALAEVRGTPAPDIIDVEEFSGSADESAAGVASRAPSRSSPRRATRQRSSARRTQGGTRGKRGDTGS